MPSFTFCSCTRSSARANEAKIVRSRDAQCNTKGPGKRGHIVADTLLLLMFLGRANVGHKRNVVFPCCANWETFVADTKFVSETNVARAGKRGNICVDNNVSATMCPRLPGP